MISSIIRDKLVSAKIFKSILFWFNLSHLIFTCSKDSSAVIYKTFSFTDIFPADWRTIVLLPMPGSPPSKTTDPGTIPPPRTRSNSLKPLVNLEIFFDEISLNGIDFLQFFIFFISWYPDLLLFIYSTIEFHELQFRHLPKYWEVSDPQFWQIKVDNLLDI